MAEEGRGVMTWHEKRNIAEPCYRLIRAQFLLNDLDIHNVREGINVWFEFQEYKVVTPADNLVTGLNYVELISINPVEL